jgi:4'-phosphopantetheinyl transferase EntD
MTGDTMPAGFETLIARLNARLPPGLVLLASPTGDDEDHLYPVERARIAGAVTSRRREFATGRALARQALERLGIGPVAIPAGDGSEPVWPSGIVGSITHSGGFCAVLLGRTVNYRGVGIDVEVSRPPADDIARLVVNPSEPAEYHRQPWLQTVFSAKESIYKCLYPTHRAFIDFQDVTVRLEYEAGAFTAAPLAPAVRAAGVERGCGLFERSTGGVATVFTADRSSVSETGAVRVCIE